MGSWTANFSGSNGSTYTEESYWLEGLLNTGGVQTTGTWSQGVYSTTVTGISAASSFRNTSTSDFASSISSTGGGSTTPSSSSGTTYSRAYYWLTPGGTSASYIALDWSDVYYDYFASQFVWGIFVDGGGTLYAGSDSAGSGLNVDQTSGGAIPFGAWFRMEVQMVSGVCTTIQIFKGPNVNSIYPDITLNTSGYYSIQTDAPDGAYLGLPNRELGFMTLDISADVGYGWTPLISDTALGAYYYMSAVDFSTSTWVGPYAGGPPPPPATPFSSNLLTMGVG